ncbi:MAG: methyltransferase domain-containing protein [Verrucomicrobia bacterium]|nr:methyltransferase domain-containing protein [Verrucomicrobiota bacterium]
MPTWNAEQYLRFAEERTRPCRDLVARIELDNPERVIDLGCGPGNSTLVLINRWPNAVITGVDHSPDMIASAKQAGYESELGDISTWQPSVCYDLIFSNAALQWVPDHSKLYPRLFRYVKPGGAFAVQVPGNYDAPAHRLTRELAHSAEWRDKFVGPSREWFTHDLPFYYDLLAPYSSKLDLWATEYVHVLTGVALVVEWYKGTGLRPFLDALPSSSLKEQFVSEYLALIAKEFPHQADSNVLFPFRRLFLVAYRR